MRLTKANAICVALAVMALALLAPWGAAQNKMRVLSGSEIQKITEAVPDKPTAPPAKPRKILIFWRCEGFFHQDGISAGNKAFEIMGQKTGAFTTVVSDDMAMMDAEKLKEFDAVLFNNTTGLKFSNPDQRKALFDFIKSGKGFIGVHGASDNFPTWPEAVEMVGGQFDGHPWGGGGTWAIKIDEPDHQLNKGFGGKGFMIKDEIYQVKGPYSRDTHRVLLSLDMDNEENLKVDQKGFHRADKDFAISWIKEWNGGRVFYCGLGHNAEVFWNKGVVQHYLDGIQWALGDLKADPTPSSKLSPKPKPALTTSAGADPYETLLTWDFDQSRAAVAALEERLRGASPAELKEAEANLIKVLQNPKATYAGKDYACRILRLIGSAQSVPVLAGMLTDEKQTDIARHALEGMREPESSQSSAAAGKALRDALGKTSGAVKEGVISSLAVRRDRECVADLGKLAAGDDAAMALAAIKALGRIGGAEAAKALSGAAASDALKTAKADALMECADSLLKEGKDTEASAIYRDLTAAGNPTPVRIAAYRGMVLSDKEKAVPTVIALMKESDLKLQAAAGKFIREIPGGEKTSKALADALPSLPPASQIVLINGLAGRAMAAAAENKTDKSAEPAVVECVKSQDAGVRMAAIQALAALGGAQCIPVLAERMKSDNDEGKAAAASLDRVKGAGVDEAIVKQMEAGDARMRIALIKSLSGRGATVAAAALLKTAADADGGVRDEAIKALGVLAGENEIGEMVSLTLKTQEDKDRKALGKALVAACKRIKDETKRADKVLAAVAAAPAAAKAVLLQVLGPLGGAKSLEVVVAALKDANPDVVDGAVRSLCDWPDPAPAGALLDLAQNAKDQKHRILSLRAYIGMIGMGERTADEKEKMLDAGMKTAQRAEDKKAVIDAVSNKADVATLAFLEKNFGDPDAGADAKSAFLRIFKENFKGKGPRGGWKLTASANEDKAINAIDGDLATRWDSGSPQAPGQWFMADIGAEKEITGLTLDAKGSASDFPVKYEVYVSNDDKKMGEPVAKGDGQAGVMEIALSPSRRGRYVKIAQLGKSESWFWSIHELMLSGPSFSDDKMARLTKIYKEMAGGELDRKKWKVTASSSAGDGPATAAIDGNANSRWGMGKMQAPGQWFQVDLGAEATVMQITLDAGIAPNDYPRGYKVFVSNDPGNWGAPVATGKGTKTITDILIPAAKSGRYVRIETTDSNNVNWWSITEMQIMGKPGAAVAKGASGRSDKSDASDGSDASDRPKAGGASSSQASAALPQGAPAVEVLAKNAKINGDGAVYEDAADRDCIGSWKEESAWVIWQAEIKAPGAYAVCALQSMNGFAGSEYDVFVGDQKVSGVVKDTGDWAGFEEINLGTVKIEKAGAVTISVKPTKRAGDWIMNLRAVRLYKK
ncbi:MAG: ThuA domain-containing protein [Candidatus Sumerlaeota bacterium]|nr:ThuA domain-containing protein [Candidatus Sumerlaeota bacterium]